ncbi:MAG: hypothetical protein HKN91_03650, partial [Acidimicrobiia bacterium]|nr:hypothetical protein [Acidimicrobiia bacterium]
MTFAVHGAGQPLRTPSILTRVLAVIALAASILIAVPAPSDALAVTVNFDLATSNTGESGTHDVVVTLDTGGATTTADIVVDIADNGGTASPGDYTLGATQLIFPSPITGTASQDVSVTIATDDLSEADEEFELELSVPANPDGAAGGPTTTHTVTILDDDPAGVTVSTGSLNVTEGAAAATYTVVLDSQPTADVTITASVTDDLAGVDPISVTFTPGNWSTPADFDVEVPDDDIAEGNRADVVTHAATSADADYAGITIADVDLVI